MRVQFTVRDLMKIVLVCACGFWLVGMLPYIDTRPTSGHPGNACRSNIRQIGLAMSQYHNDYGCFPPAYVADKNGKPMHSWRTLLLPYLDQKDIYDHYKFDEPRDSPSNRGLGDIYIKLFTCPDNSSVIQRRGQTNYVVIVGPKTAFPGGTSTSSTAIGDKPSETILIVEVPHSNIKWSEPRDLDANTMSLQINDPNQTGIGGMHEGGAYVVCADGTVRKLSNSLSPTTLKALTTIHGGERINLKELEP